MKLSGRGERLFPRSAAGVPSSYCEAKVGLRDVLYFCRSAHFIALHR